MCGCVCGWFVPAMSCFPNCSYTLSVFHNFFFFWGKKKWTSEFSQVSLLLLSLIASQTWKHSLIVSTSSSITLVSQQQFAFFTSFKWIHGLSETYYKKRTSHFSAALEPFFFPPSLNFHLPHAGIWHALHAQNPNGRKHILNEVPRPMACQHSGHRRAIHLCNGMHW